MSGRVMRAELGARHSRQLRGVTDGRPLSVRPSEREHEQQQVTMSDRRQGATGPQLLTVLAVSFGPFSVGLSKGYSSPALASLAASNMGVTHQESSWLASLSLLGALLGGLLSSIVLRCGRKNSLLLVSLPFSASWMLTVFATSVEMMFCTAFMAGLCSAIVIVVSQVTSYVSLLQSILGGKEKFEISHVSISYFSVIFISDNAISYS